MRGAAGTAVKKGVQTAVVKGGQMLGRSASGSGGGGAAWSRGTGATLSRAVPMDSGLTSGSSFGGKVAGRLGKAAIKNVLSQPPEPAGGGGVGGQPHFSPAAHAGYAPSDLIGDMRAPQRQFEHRPPG